MDPEADSTPVMLYVTVGNIKVSSGLCGSADVQSDASPPEEPLVCNGGGIPGM